MTFGNPVATYAIRLSLDECNHLQGRRSQGLLDCLAHHVSSLIVKAQTTGTVCYQKDDANSSKPHGSPASPVRLDHCGACDAINTREENPRKTLKSRSREIEIGYNDTEHRKEIRMACDTGSMKSF